MVSTAPSRIGETRPHHHSHDLPAAHRSRTRTDLLNFLQQVKGQRCTVVPGLTGITVQARYERGQLTALLTRGTGASGEDVTGRAHRPITGLARPLHGAWSGTVTGTVYLSKEGLQAARARRVAAGHSPEISVAATTIAALRGTTDPCMQLSFVAEAITGDNTTDILAELDGYRQRMDYARMLGLTTADGLLPGPATISADPDELIRAAEEIISGADLLPGHLEAALITVASATARHTLQTGWLTRYRESAVSSTVTGITIGISRTGTATFRAQLEPVELQGRTITTATVPGLDWIAQHQLSCGDRVLLDDLPSVGAAVVDRIPGQGNKSRPWTMPATCPSCAQPWQSDRGRPMCRTDSCSLVSRILYAAEVWHITDLSEDIVRGLVDAGTITDIADVFTLTAESLQRLLVRRRRVGQVVASRIQEQVQAAKRQPLDRTVAALGISGIGSGIAAILARAFPRLSTLTQASGSDLQALPGVGAARAAAIRAGLDAQAVVLLKLMERGLEVAPQRGEGTGRQEQKPLAHQAVVVTGVVAPFRSRTEAELAVGELGGTVMAEVITDTSVVIAGPGAGEKLRLAVELGIDVLPAEQFRSLYEQRFLPARP